MVAFLDSEGGVKEEIQRQKDFDERYFVDVEVGKLKREDASN